jgi:hypothetical protein
MVIEADCIGSCKVLYAILISNNLSDECVQYLYLPNGKAFNSIFHQFMNETTKHWNKYIYTVNIYNLYEEYVYSAQKRLLYINIHM